MPPLARDKVKKLNPGHSGALIPLALLLGGWFQLVSAQTTMPGPSVTAETATPIAGVGHDYIHLLAETVDPSSGAVNISINFPVAGSRGITLPVSLRYHSSGVFQVGQPNTTLGLTTYCPTNAPNTAIPFGNACGWQYSLPSFGYSSATFSPLSGPPGGECYVTNHFTFTDPEGTGHNLYGLAQTWQSGSTTFCPNQLGGPTVSPATSGSDDEVSAALPQGAQPAGVTVDDTKGTVYSNFNSFGPHRADNLFVIPESVEDRNGNIIQTAYSYNTTSNQYSVTVTDTAARPALTISGTGYSGTADTVTAGGSSFSVNWTTITTPSYAYEWVQPPTQNATDMSISLVSPTNQGWSCPENGFSPSSPINVVSAIHLPNGQQFRIYSGEGNPTDSTILNPYGLVNEIVYPDGGWVKYTYKPSDTYSLGMSAAGLETEENGSTLEIEDGCLYRYTTPVVATRQVSYDGLNVVLEQTFTYTTAFTSGSQYWTSKQTTVSTTDYVANDKTQTTIYTYLPFLLPVEKYSGAHYGTQLPLENQTSTYDWGNPSNPLETTTKTWVDQFSMSEEDRTEGSATAKTKYSPGSYRPTEIDEYDFGASTAARKTLVTYQPISSLGVIYDEPCSTVEENGSASWVAETDYYYDGGTALCGTDGAGSATNSVTPALPTGTHDETHFGPFASSSLPRGNLTKEVRLLAQGGSGPTTTYTYDETGQPATMTDPCGNSSCTDMTGTGHTTSYSFTDSPTGGNPNGNSNAYLTQITYPSVNGTSHIENFRFNYQFGYLTQSEDENGKYTYYTYNTPPSGCSYSDGLNRLSTVTLPDSGETTYCYNDSGLSTTTTTYQTPDPARTSVSMTDGMGHVVETQLTSDPYGVDTVLTTYDGGGHVHTQTNPYQSTSDSSYGLTTFSYDALGRTIQEQMPDTSTVQTCYDGVRSTPAVQNCPALVSSSSTPGSVTGTWVDVTDEDGNQWQRASDAFGRLTQVMEPNGTTQAPVMQTTYNFDVLGNLLSATQNGISGSSWARVRTFNYDALSRLLCSSNPETSYASCPTAASSSYVAGTNGYAYDANGNLASKMMPAPNSSVANNITLTTSFSYDPLNRVTEKSFSNNDLGKTPVSCFQYDTSAAPGAGGNLIGRLTNEWTSSASSSCTPPPSGSYYNLRSILSYDPMGRITNEQQCIPNSCSSGSGPALTYGYDVAGNATSLINSVGAFNSNGQPTSLTLTSGFDGAAHVNGVTSSWTTFPTNLYTLSGHGAIGPTGWCLGASSCTSAPPINFSQSFTKRLWVSGISAAGVIP
jgi:hypothetical protein